MKAIARKLYAAIPFKKELFTFLKKVYQPHPDLYRHLHFKGVVTIPVDETISFKIKHHGYQIENELFWGGISGQYEKQSMRLWMNLCRQSRVILDVGANTGVYSLVAKSLNRGAIVCAFEPVKRIFFRLEENNAINGYDIHCLECALSNKNETAVIYDAGEEHMYSVAVNKNLEPSYRKVKEVVIETITLDTVVEKLALQKIDLMKIDVEGHEVEVMQGFRIYLKKFKPTILVEVLEDEVGAQLQEIFHDLDYLYFNIDEDKGVRQVQNICKSDSYNYLICSRETARELQL